MDAMDKNIERLERITYKSYDIALEYERSLVKYIIAGNGAALIFILSMFRSKNIQPDFFSIFILPMWGFGFGLLFSVFGFFLSYMFTKKVTENSGKMYLLHLRSTVVQNKTDDYVKKFSEDTEQYSDNGTRLNKRFLPIIYLFQSIAALLFSSSLIASLWKVSV